MSSYASLCGSPRSAQGLDFSGVDSSRGRTCSTCFCILLTYFFMPALTGATEGEGEGEGIWMRI
jgi:hypothetical protein